MKSRKKLFPPQQLNDIDLANMSAPQIIPVQSRQNDEVYDSYFANVRIVKADSKDSYSGSVAGSDYIVEEMENKPSEFQLTPGPIANDIRVDYLSAAKKMPRTEGKD